MCRLDVLWVLMWMGVHSSTTNFPHPRHPWGRCCICSAPSENIAVLRASRCLNKSLIQESSTILAIQRQAGFFFCKAFSKQTVRRFQCEVQGAQGLGGAGRLCSWSVGLSPSPERSSPALLRGAWSGEVDRGSALYINLVLISQEYGLYPFKHRSYFSLAN